VKADEKDVVREQHKPAELIGNSAFAKSVVSKITCFRAKMISFDGPEMLKRSSGGNYRLTNILNLRVLHDEFVHGNGGDPEEDTGEDHSDDSWNPSQDAGVIRPSVIAIFIREDGTSDGS
jgi:hypothetical protein